MVDGAVQGQSGTRSPARGRILRAAGELFEEQGFRVTTTRQISARAKVAEPTIFRHFNSKADLFEASVAEPFVAFVSEWTERWHFQAEASSVDQLAQQLVDGLLGLVKQNRRVLFELIIAREDEASDLHDQAVRISARVREAMRVVHDAGLEIADAKDLRSIDAAANIGGVAGMVFGAVLLRDWVFPAGIRVPGSGRLAQELTTIVVQGISHRDA